MISKPHDVNPFPDGPPLTKEQEEYLDASEAVFWLAARRARDAGREQTPCPTCGGTISLCYRTERMTFGGLEPACVQVSCENCGGGDL